MLTGDLNIVDLTWIIEYRITDPRAWLFNVDDSRIQGSRVGIQGSRVGGSRVEDNRDKTLRDVTQSVVNSLVGDRAILDVISTEKDSIQFLSKQKIQEKLDLYDLGVSITEVKLQQVEPPAGEVQDAFEDVNKATQDRKRLINEGNAPTIPKFPVSRARPNRYSPKPRDIARPELTAPKPKCPFLRPSTTSTAAPGM